jgi:outer membrane protein assembly factor BamB
MIRLFAISSIIVIAAFLNAGDWPTWRGPTSDGSIIDPAIPTEWSESKNIAWKIDVPGVGNSSPVIAGGQLYLTTCIDKSRCVLCYDASTGKLLWQTEVATADIEKMHKNNSPASATPVTDGKHVWVTFLIDSSIKVACLDSKGKLIWTQNFPGFVCTHGFCGTPILDGNRVVINGDSDGDAFLAALEKETGKVIWKIARPNRTRSYSVPLILDVEGKKQLVLAGSKSVSGFNPSTGEQIWFTKSATDKFVASVVHVDGLVIATGTSPVSTLAAIRTNGHGDVTDTHTAWSIARGAAYVPSPLAVGKNVFVQGDDGRATFLEAKTGKMIWNERIGKKHVASPLLINNLIYSLADDGTMYVIRPGSELELISKNQIGETCNATPAVANGKLYIRSESHLWCIRNE